MAADIRVGVTRITDGRPSEPGEKADGEMRAHWVDLDGKVLTADEHGLKSVEYHADGEHPSTVTLVFYVASFGTVQTETYSPKDRV